MFGLLMSNSTRFIYRKVSSACKKKQVWLSGTQLVLFVVGSRVRILVGDKVGFYFGLWIYFSICLGHTFYLCYQSTKLRLLLLF